MDEGLVIIAGHTRYAALKVLGYDEIDVIVSDMPAKKAKEYRIIDNRTSEYATWNPDELLMELKEFVNPLTAQSFFPELKFDINFAEIDFDITQSDVTTAEMKSLAAMQSLGGAEVDNRLVGLICPNCSEEFTISMTEILRPNNWVTQDGESMQRKKL